ncbi:MAG TPA: HAMP domain-containing sensor histidine kinase [Anaerolineales bacterium]|nr:HAMP domain-containing sensor histidine kinase [Anaerolineales bacterium]
MRGRPALLLTALAPIAAVLGLALASQQGWLANYLLVGTYRMDLVGLLSRVGLLMGLLLMGAVGVWWRMKRLVDHSREDERERQEEAGRRFLGRLDHELKNPLTIMRLGVANLQQDRTLTGEQSQSLERVAQQVHRLQKLAEDLRSLSELDAAELERAPVGIGPALAEARALALNALGEGKRVVGVNFQQAPWPVGTVMGDRDLLIIAFRNLLDNALKFSDAGGQVEVRATDDGNMAVVEVADTGSGIPEEEIGHVFEELYRGEAAKGVDGSGLGLSLVRRIVRMHDGDVDVRSRVGRGTVVTVRLPLAPAEKGI